jgi:hypothetical protein
MRSHLLKRCFSLRIPSGYTSHCGRTALLAGPLYHRLRNFCLGPIVVCHTNQELAMSEKLAFILFVLIFLLAVVAVAIAADSAFYAYITGG